MTSESPQYVVFDMQTVLCQYRPEVRNQALAQAAGLTSASVAHRINETFVDQCACGHYAIEDMLTEVRTRLDTDLTYAHLMSLWALAYEPQMNAIIAIGRWLQQHAQLSAASLCNDCALLDVGLWAYLPEVNDLIAAQHYSYQHQMPDSDPALFAAVQRKIQMPADSIRYISDSPAAQSAASSAGWCSSTLTDLLAT